MRLQLCLVRKGQSEQEEKVLKEGVARILSRAPVSSLLLLRRAWLVVSWDGAGRTASERQGS